ncbi:restriction endonuclease subunit S [Vibrio metoecus]|uniref:restriction endonuclease subunit S n=1 Tax=Vibrio metoecus TaxID=1481663 RepID=UPI0012ADD8CB|nr:restriction endonuclease subunit S [Vibrio metoecus]
MSVEKNVPEIRFKGFGGEWQEDKLGQLYSFQYGEFNNNPSNGGQYPVYGANGIIGGYTRFNARCSAVIGHMGEYAGSVLWAEGEHFVTYNGTIAKPKKSDFNPLFGYFSLVKMNLKKVCGGSGQPFLSYDALERLDFVFPAEAEQTAIGNTFQKLDSLISQHQQKHDKLSNIKKAMLEKMFPQKCETIPEIRFKGFSGEWEDKQLGTDVADIIGGGTPSTSIAEFWNGDIDWYSPTEIGDKVYAEGSQKKITALGLKSSSAKLLPAGRTVLFTSRAGIGDMAILTKPGTTNQGFQSFVVKEGFVPYFIYSAGKQIKEYALKHASGSTFLEISGKQLGRMKILLPCETEQAAIGSYFQKLDALINQHQQQITKLNNIKQACLSKMFV